MCYNHARCDRVACALCLCSAPGARYVCVCVERAMSVLRVRCVSVERAMSVLRVRACGARVVLAACALGACFACALCTC